MTHTQEIVFSVIRDNEGLNIQQISDMVAMSKRNVRNKLRKLKKHNMIIEMEHRYYIYTKENAEVKKKINQIDPSCSCLPLYHVVYNQDGTAYYTLTDPTITNSGWVTVTTTK